MSSSTPSYHPAHPVYPASLATPSSSSASMVSSAQSSAPHSSGVLDVQNYFQKREDVKATEYDLPQKSGVGGNYPTLRFSIRDVDESPWIQSLLDQAVISEGNLVGGAVRYIVSDWDFGDVDVEYPINPQYYHPVETLDLIFHNVICFVRQQLIKKGQNDAERANYSASSDAFIRDVYLYKKKLMDMEHELISYIGLGGIDLKFVLVKSPGGRKSISSSDGFRIMLRQNRLFCATGYQFCETEGAFQAMADLNNGIFSVIDPANVFRLIFPLVHRWTQGYECSHEYDQIAFDQLQKEFPLELQHVQRISLQEVFQNYLEGHYFQDPFGKVLFFLNFLTHLSSFKEGTPYCRLIALGWLSDLTHQEAGTHAPLYKFAQLVYVHPELTQPLLALMRGAFFMEWMRENPQISAYHFNSKKQQNTFYRLHFSFVQNGKTHCLAVRQEPDHLILDFLESWLEIVKRCRELGEETHLSTLFQGLGFTTLKLTQSDQKIVADQLMRVSSSPRLKEWSLYSKKAEPNFRALYLFLCNRMADVANRPYLDHLLLLDDLEVYQTKSYHSLNKVLLAQRVLQSLKQENQNALETVLTVVIAAFQALQEKGKDWTKSNDLEFPKLLIRGLFSIFAKIFIQPTPLLIDQMHHLLQLLYQERVLQESDKNQAYQIGFRAYQWNESRNPQSSLISAYPELSQEWIEWGLKKEQPSPEASSSSSSSQAAPSNQISFHVHMLKALASSDSITILGDCFRYLKAIQKAVGPEVFSEGVHNIAIDLMQRAMGKRDEHLDRLLCQTAILLFEDQNRSLEIRERLSSLTMQLFSVAERLSVNLEKKKNLNLTYQLMESLLIHEQREEVRRAIRHFVSGLLVRSLENHSLNGIERYPLGLAGAWIAKYGDKPEIGYFGDEKFQDYLLALSEKLMGVEDELHPIGLKIQKALDQEAQKMKQNQLFKKIVGLFLSNASPLDAKRKFLLFIRMLVSLLREQEPIDLQAITLATLLLEKDLEKERCLIMCLFYELLCKLDIEYAYSTFPSIKSQLPQQHSCRIHLLMIHSLVKMDWELAFKKALALWNQESAQITAVLAKEPTKEMLILRDTLLVALMRSGIRYPHSMTDDGLHALGDLLKASLPSTLSILLCDDRMHEELFSLTKELLIHPSPPICDQGEALFDQLNNEEVLIDAQIEEILLLQISRRLADKTTRWKEEIPLFMQIAQRLLDVIQEANEGLPLVKLTLDTMHKMIEKNSDVCLDVVFDVIVTLLQQKLSSAAIRDQVGMIILALIEKYLSKKESQKEFTALVLFRQLLHDAIIGKEQWGRQVQNLSVRLIKLFYEECHRENGEIGLLIDLLESKELLELNSLANLTAIFTVMRSMERPNAYQWLWRALQKRQYSSAQEKTQSYEKFFQDLVQKLDLKALPFIEQEFFNPHAVWAQPYLNDQIALFYGYIFQYFEGLSIQSNDRAIARQCADLFQRRCQWLIEVLPPNTYQSQKKQFSCSLIVVFSRSNSREYIDRACALMSASLMEPDDDPRYMNAAVKLFTAFLENEEILKEKITDGSFQDIIHRALTISTFRWGTPNSAVIIQLIECIFQQDGKGTYELANSILVHYCLMEDEAVGIKIKRARSRADLINSVEIGQQKIDRLISLCRSRGYTMVWEQLALMFDQPLPPLDPSLSSEVSMLVYPSFTWQTSVELQVGEHCYEFDKLERTRRRFFKRIDSKDGQRHLCDWDPFIRVKIKVAPEELDDLRKHIHEVRVLTPMISLGSILARFFKVRIPSVCAMFPMPAIGYLMFAKALGNRKITSISIVNFSQPHRKFYSALVWSIAADGVLTYTPCLLASILANVCFNVQVDPLRMLAGMSVLSVAILIKQAVCGCFGFRRKQ